MPVPVPRYSRPPAHPVFKQGRYSGDLNYPQSSAFPNLTTSIPLPAPGPPPSFGTREEWISSLPLWRRNKPRRIWEEGDSRLTPDSTMQDFSSGLIRAGNAQIIKGDRAQACIPPLLTLYHAEQPRYPQHLQDFEDDVDEIGSGSLDFEIESQWSAGTPRSEDLAEMEIDPICDHRFVPTTGDGTLHTTDVFLRRQPGLQFDDSFPDAEPVAVGDPASSPLGPITPFGVFVDRAVAASDFSDGSDSPKVALSISVPFDHEYGPPPPATAIQYEVADQRLEELTAPDDIVSISSATLSYKKVADPLAEWVATFVWKVCTTGMCLSAQYRGGPVEQHSPPPPPYLVNSVRSLLLSTLLQPSAVLLAIWYIVRLPVRFGRISLRADALKEARFRLELFGFGEWQDSSPLQAVEAHAPFRLVLLGCMLANKWLDDHTFSNKTWHTISGVPIQSLNRLESLALDIFSYDLSITPSNWTKWLVQVLAYHKSLSSALNPQPISRPSSNPHFVVRKMIGDLLETTSRSRDDTCPNLQPQPVFLGLDERRRERLDPTPIELNSETLEIDLDEDGPLREEYMPRRRVSRNEGYFRGISHNTIGASFGFGFEMDIERQRAPEIQRPLPPPAKWSPAADEPLRRDVVRETTYYMAIQPPPIPPLVMIPQYPP
ncbi:hypothetical protein F5148DRAFT_963059, partial [Russula earlei]